MRRWLLAAGFLAVGWSGCYLRSLKIGCGGVGRCLSEEKGFRAIVRSCEAQEVTGMFWFFSDFEHQSATGLRGKAGGSVFAQDELGPVGKDRCLGDKALKTVLQRSGK